MTETIIKPQDIGSNVNTKELSEKKVINRFAVVENEPQPKATPTSTSEATEATEAKEEGTSILLRANKREREISEREKKLKQDKQEVDTFKQLMAQAREDPTILAKALNMDPQDLYNKYTNKVLSLPDKQDPPSPEKQRQSKLEQIEKQQAFLLEQQARLDRANFIKDNIAPHTVDADKFPLINKDKEAALQYMYDTMNAHFLATGGMKNGQPVGEILSAADLAEELENLLTEKAEENIDSMLEDIKKVPKLASKFSSTTVSEKPNTPKTVSNNLGKSASGGLPTEIKSDKKVVSATIMTPKEARLQRTKQELERKGIKW